MALRCALLALLALALARPSIVTSGVLGDQEAPVAAALVFDTSPRMEYRQQNQTRLEVAQETAEWLLPQLPPESDVAVVDSRSGVGGVCRRSGRGAPADRAARRRPDVAAAWPWRSRRRSQLVRESDKPRKEVYVFTDLSRGRLVGRRHAHRRAATGRARATSAST